MDTFQSHQIARIVLRMRFGVATEEEKQLFEVWIKNGEGRQVLYDKIVSGESLKEYLNLKADYGCTVDKEKLQSAIFRSLEKRDRQRRVKRYFLWWGSAAAVLLVACTLVFEYTKIPTDMVQEKFRVAQVISETRIQDKVILVLADGKKVGMSGIQQDTMRVGAAVVMGQRGKLVYDYSLAREDSVLSRELEMNKIITTTGGFYSLVLSDGTRIWLNSESELEYPVLFGRGERGVRLEGEAFFEVMPDASRPFVVRTGEICTRVLGTSFNIKAYKNESGVTTTLFTGKVDVASLADMTQHVVLSPGKQVDWDLQTRRLEVREANLDNIKAWKEGMFVFSKENIEVVTRQIERWYGVKFIYETAKREQYTFNGYFSKDETLESILEALTFTGGPKFKIDGNTVYVNR